MYLAGLAELSCLQETAITVDGAVATTTAMHFRRFADAISAAGYKSYGLELINRFAVWYYDWVGLVVLERRSQALVEVDLALLGVDWLFGETWGPTTHLFFLAAEIAQAEADRCTEELRGIRRAHRHRGTRHEGVVHRVTQFVEMFGYSEGFVRAYGSEL